MSFKRRDGRDKTFRDMMGAPIVPDDTVLIPGFVLAQATMFDPEVYGDDQIMITICKGGEQLFYPSEDLLRVDLNEDGSVRLPRDVIHVPSRYGADN